MIVFTITPQHAPDGVALASGYLGLCGLVVDFLVFSAICAIDTGNDYDFGYDAQYGWTRLQDHPWVKIVAFISLGLLALGLVMKIADACYKTCSPSSEATV